MFEVFVLLDEIQAKNRASHVQKDWEILRQHWKLGLALAEAHTEGGSPDEVALFQPLTHSFKLFPVFHSLQWQYINS